jgi:hypothetical protein
MHPTGLTDPAALAETVWELLQQRDRLAAIGAKAAIRARGWTTRAYALALERIVQGEP